METDEIFDKLRQELRRGAIVMSVLGALRNEHYGYSLRKYLLEHNLEVDEGTLYPLIRRLEKQGLLTSEWRDEDNRKKRFYTISNNGQLVFSQLKNEWDQINGSINSILSE